MTEDKPKLQPKILPILTYPDDKLHEQCSDVTEFNNELEQLAIDLFSTMKSHMGVGLAAPQVGVMKNFITVWVDRGAPLALCNPKIISRSEDEFTFEEGCLSVPGYFMKNKRPNTIIVQYQDISGEHKEIESRGLNAFVIQHEVDHLKGKLFIDGLSTFKKAFVKKKIKSTLKKQKPLPLDL